MTAGPNGTEGTDSGLQAERTAMAWQRTALGLGAVSALALHHARAEPLRAAPGVLGLLAAVFLLVVVDTRYLRTRRHVEEGTTPMGRRAVLLLTLATSLLAVGAAAVVVASAGGH